jgi:hypothetical protein
MPSTPAWAMNILLERMNWRTQQCFCCETILDAAKESVCPLVDSFAVCLGVRRRQFGFQPKGCHEAGPDRSTFAVISLWGKFGGLHTCAGTLSYIVALPNIFLTRLFSNLRLKRKDFQEILRLPWAQEAPGSSHADKSCSH